MMLKKIYEAAVKAGEIENDPNQRQILETIEILEERLTAAPKRRPFWQKKPPLKGIYIHGPVGVGKTFLMDLFFENIALEKKCRFHFHHFMQKIDAELRRLQGTKNPLKIIAEALAKSASVLCFDEFLVHDVADAMILAELLKALLEKNIILIATSNISPDNLYLNGAHRERFLPAIAMIKAHCEVLHLQTNRDYRLGRALSIQTYFYPLNQKNKKLFAAQFEHLEPEAIDEASLTIQNRPLTAVRCGNTAVWFDFKVLCNIPRSQLDYLEISARFDTVFLDNLPVLSENDTLGTILLIHMVDVFYDRGIKLILCAATSLENLYTTGEMLTEFKRTYSRLQEMQAADYLKRHPRRQL